MFKPRHNSFACRCVVDWAKAHAAEVRVDPVVEHGATARETVVPGFDAGVAASR